MRWPKRDKIKDAHYEQHYVYNAHYHIIWCTKYRNQIFDTPELAEEMRNLLLEIATSYKVEIEKMEVMP